MIPRVKQQETIANNIANASSPGFKKDSVFTKELSRVQQKQMPRQADWQQPMIDQIYTSYENGPLDKTDNPLDIALEGTGFFVFQDEQGREVLSRAGNLRVDENGFLINTEGLFLLGEGGPINVGEGSVTVGVGGQIEINQVVIDTIRVVDVEDKNELVKADNNSFLTPEGIEAVRVIDFAIRQGYLESSNVDIIKEMVSMIIAFRNYEADARAVQTQDDSLEKLLNNVGRIR